ncbi:MAG: chemotaxis response regulator protein-glutamate methylesterase [Pacificimonas sp.]
MTSSTAARAEAGARGATSATTMPRVMLVDDSGVSRALMARWLTEAGVEIVAQARNGEEARDTIVAANPDIVLLDIEMPRLGGIDVLPHLLKRVPGVKIVMVSTLSRRNARITIEALRAGATDALAKPDSGWAGTSAPAFRDELVRKVRDLGEADTVAVAIPDVAPRPWPQRVVQKPSPPASPVKARGSTGIVVIGSSTGGPNALFTMLKHLPSSPAVPILIAQHMPPMFTSILGEHITRLTGISAAEAKHREPVVPGRIYIAPGGRHMSMSGGPKHPLICISDDPPENFCRPSVNPLFRSAASGWGENAFGIVLTGMGSDGLDGARALKAVGAQVMVQDAASSVVWGMPGSVFNAGLADAVMDLDGLGTFLATELGAMA